MEQIYWVTDSMRLRDNHHTKSITPSPTSINNTTQICQTKNIHLLNHCTNISNQKAYTTLIIVQIYQTKNTHFLNHPHYTVNVARLIGLMYIDIYGSLLTNIEASWLLRWIPLQNERINGNGEISPEEWKAPMCPYILGHDPPNCCSFKSD